MRSTEPETIAEQVIKRRREFVDTLCISLGFSSVQRESLGRALVLTGESRFNIYFNYPYRFREAFPRVTDDVLLELSWCGRVALDYILLYDYLLDTNRPPDPSILMGSYAFQREWLCGLQRLFPSNSPFWDYLIRYEEETMRALLEEHLQRQTPLSPFTLDDYRRQAIGKAALARLAIVALASLSDQVGSEGMHSLIRSVDHHNFARQIVDDLLDWRKDCNDQRASYLLSAAMRYLNSEDCMASENHLKTDEVGSVLYTQIAPTCLDLAEKGLLEALDLANAYGPCPYWQQALETMVATIRQQRTTIAEITGRPKPDRLQAIRSRNPQRSEIATAVEAAAAFLTDRQELEGCWRDFATAASESEDWITGYVGWAMCNAKKLSSEALQRAVTWLQGSQFPEGGWGYRRDVVADADSTAWCLRFLAYVLDRQDVEKALQILLKHQHVTGGFSTYDDPDDIRAWMQMEETQDFSGWCEPQLCVTAAATGALLDWGFDANIDPVVRAIDYLVAHQQPRGYWHSYWWAGPHYATANILQVISQLDNADENAIALAHNWLINSQRTDGGWSHAPGQPSTPFYTALGLLGLLARRNPDPSTLRAVKRGIVWLVKNQEQEGNWRSSALLLLPQPHEREPWKIERWPISVHGTGIARRDHRHIFTTATVLAALSRAMDICADLNL